MSESYVQLPADSTGKKLRTIKRTVGANEVHEEAVQIIEPTGGAAIDPRTITIGVDSVGLAKEVGGNLASILAQILLVKVKTDNLDLAITGFRDALRGASDKDLTTLQASLEAQLNITQSALRDAILGVSTKDFTTLQAVLEALSAKITACNTGAITIGTALPAGNNNIGDMDVASLPTLPAGSNNIGDVDLASAIPTGSAVIGKVGIDQTTPGTTNRVTDKHDMKVYKTALFDASASGNLVAAVASKVIKLHALTVQAQGSVIVNFNDGLGGASLMKWSFQAREGAVVPFAPAPAYWMKTSVNTALYVTLSAAIVVTITAIYSDDDAA